MLLASLLASLQHTSLAPLELAVPGVRTPSARSSAEEEDEDGLSLEARLMATLPEGMSLDFPAQTMAGQTFQRPNRVRWSPDGRRVAYIGILDGKEHPVIGDEVLDDYDYTGGPYFSSGCSSVVFGVGNRVSKKREKWWLLLDGRQIFDEDWIGPPALSADGEALAVWTQPGARIQSGGEYNNNGQIFVLLERKGRSWKARESSRYNNAASMLQPVFVGDSNRALAAAGEEPWLPTLLLSLEPGARKAKVEDELDRLPALLSADRRGKRWGATFEEVGIVDGAYTLKTEAVWIDGEPVEHDYGGINGPFFSSLDDRTGFRVWRGDLYGIAVDDDDIELAFEFVYPPVFGAGKRLAFVATEGAELQPNLGMSTRNKVEGGERFVVRRQAKGPDEAQDGRWLEVRDLAFSPDGEHLAYAARAADGWRIVQDGVEGPIFDGVGAPHFSEDSASLVHGAREGRELWWRVWEPGAGEAAAPAGDPDEEN